MCKLTENFFQPSHQLKYLIYFHEFRAPIIYKSELTGTLTCRGPIISIMACTSSAENILIATEHEIKTLEEKNVTPIFITRKFAS